RTVYKYPYDSGSGLYDIARVAVWTAPDPTAAPYGLAFDQGGNLYIAGFGGGAYSTGTKIFRVDQSGNSSIFFDAQTADPQSIYFNAGGSWQVPTGLAFDTHGYLYASYYSSLKIVRIAPDGSFVVLPGGGTGDDAANGIAIGPQGDLFTVVNGGRTTASPAVLQVHGMVPAAPTVSLSVPQTTCAASAPQQVCATYRSTFTVSTTTNASTSPSITATGACTNSGNTVTMTSGTGTCILTASWPADVNYIAATATQMINAATASSTTTLSSSFNPAIVGQSVTFTAAVTSLIPGTPTGTVTFYDGATSLGSSSLAQATISTISLSAGTHSITATYGGDANYASSASVALSQSIVQSPPPTVFIAINEAIKVGDAESFPDVASNESIKVTDAVTVTPLINVAAPVAFFSAGSLGFANVAAGQAGMPLTASAIGQAPLMLSS
ncbi:MAG: Ig-like domain repeat protein, partial [Acidobacteria bacterium Pan2503]|nr:Ig-like domain repeat protein [Candidatus Acidoferrum panamensis]